MLCLRPGAKYTHAHSAYDSASTSHSGSNSYPIAPLFPAPNPPYSDKEPANELSLLSFLSTCYARTPLFIRYRSITQPGEMLEFDVVYQQKSRSRRHCTFRYSIHLGRRIARLRGRMLYKAEVSLGSLEFHRCWEGVLGRGIPTLRGLLG